jgi:hypothetical protein
LPDDLSPPRMDDDLSPPRMDDDLSPPRMDDERPPPCMDDERPPPCMDDERPPPCMDDERPPPWPCCANTRAAINATIAAEPSKFFIFILKPRWILHPQPIGLDGEEIETVRKLKGLPLRRAHG